MGLVISPNLQTRAYGACERPPVSPDFRVPPTSKHLAPSLPQTAAARNALAAEMSVPTNHHQLLHIVDFFRQQHLSHIHLFICRTTVAFYSMKIHGSTNAVTATQNQQQFTVAWMYSFCERPIDLPSCI